MKENNEDMVNHPSHYTQGIEVTDYISSWQMDWFRGNIIKYVTRCPYKGDSVQDLKKARWYINDLIDRLEKGDIPSSCY